MKIYNFLYVMFICFSCSSLHKQEYSKTCMNAAYDNVEFIPVGEICESNSRDSAIVKVEGFFYYNFEDVALYSEKHDNSSSKAIWINFTEEMLKYEDQIKKLVGKNVTVSGILNLSKKGHLGSYCGTIDSVFCIKEIR